MSQKRIIFTAEDRARLAQMGARATSLTLKTMGLSHNKPPIIVPGKNSLQKTAIGVQSQYKFPEFRKKPLLPSKKLPMETLEKAQEEPVVPSPAPAIQEIEMTREECFSCAMDILLEGMSASDKACKEAAKNLLIVMGNECGNSVSVIIYNSYVRKYNSLREQYFLTTAANIKAKTIRLRDDILQSIEQLSKTIKIEMPPALKMAPVLNLPSNGSDFLIRR